ncbi:hypothetical protein GCM10007874_56810 [Labrys miyagiensis]|uniref:Uncharacterized protein n=1 Tax=Labrys miyagiensis TaxID=346912 RepID=A0ABQ6CQN3_9HYPH|nr:hypothetical protein GCM10007874_56810 [Labrys miyagiensis]
MPYPLHRLKVDVAEKTGTPNSGRRSGQKKQARRLRSQERLWRFAYRILALKKFPLIRTCGFAPGVLASVLSTSAALPFTL